MTNAAALELDCARRVRLPVRAVEALIAAGDFADAVRESQESSSSPRDPRRLLHHVAELTGEHDAAVAAGRHRRGLDEEDLAAGAGDRETGRYARQDVRTAAS